MLLVVQPLSCISCVRIFVTLCTVDHEAPLCMGFSTKDTGVGCHPSSRGSSDPGIKLASCLLCWQESSLPIETPEKPNNN